MRQVAVRSGPWLSGGTGRVARSGDRAGAWGGNPFRAARASLACLQSCLCTAHLPGPANHLLGRGGVARTA